MDWNLAIERNTGALKRIVATLATMAGLGSKLPISPLVGEMSGRTEGGDIERNRPILPRRLHRAILRLLRPAESAVRRLIIIAARGLVVPPSPIRVRQPKPPSIFVRNRGGTGIILPPGALTKPPRPAPRAHAYPIPSPERRVTVEVLNGTRRAGVARAATRMLRRRGLDVVFYGNAEPNVGRRFTLTVSLLQEAGH